MSEGPLFHCETDPIGHGVLGYHDGIDSWTLNLATSANHELQTFVSLHEQAHHALHQTTAWGIAMLVSGVPDRHGIQATGAWMWLGRHCTDAHEQFATFAAVEGTDRGIDVLSGNYTYLAHLRNARSLCARFPASVPDTSVTDMLYRTAMTPLWLADLGIQRLRELPYGAALVPDAALQLIVQALDDSPQMRSQLGDALSEGRSYVDSWDQFAEALTSIDVPTMRWSTFEQWVHRIIDEAATGLPDRLVLATRNADPITERLDTLQRERLLIHDQPLPLRSGPADQENSELPITLFVRTSASVGPHVLLSWLHSDVLRKQFTSVPADWNGCHLGFLSCDRRAGAETAYWADFGDAPPSVVAQSVRATQFTPLLFTTLHSLEDSSTDIDFRGWDPVFVFIDGDVMVFIEGITERGAQLDYWVLGTEGSRYTDHFAIQMRDDPAMTFIYTCSEMTGRTLDLWLRQRTDARRMLAATLPARGQLNEVLEHLIGTFWVMELGRWKATTSELKQD